MPHRLFNVLIAIVACSEAGSAMEGELNREARWKGDSTAAQVRAMVFLRTSDQFLAQRVLLEFPPETHLVITNTTNPLTREVVSELRSEATGWWLRWGSTYSVGATSLKDYFNRYSEAEDAFDGTQKAIHRLSTSSGFGFERAVVLTSDAEGMMEDLYLKVSEGGEAAKLARQIPADVVPALRFVYCSQERLDSGVPYLRHLAHFVFRVLGEPVGRSACQTFTAEPLPEQRLPRLPAFSPEVLEFISQFRSVENADPLQDRRP